MLIIWDEPKRIANLLKHSMDFADLTPEFFDSAVVMPAKAGRAIAIGWFAGIGTVVVHVRYGTEAVSVVSMRRASLRERSIL